MNLSPRAPSEGRWVRHLFPLVFASQNLQKLLGFKLHPEVPVPAPGGSIIFQAATFPADPVRGRLSGVFEKAWATSRMKTQISLGDCQSKTNCLPLNKRLWSNEIDFVERNAPVGSCLCSQLFYPKRSKRLVQKATLQKSCSTPSLPQTAWCTQHSTQKLNFGKFRADRVYSALVSFKTCESTFWQNFIVN